MVNFIRTKAAIVIVILTSLLSHGRHVAHAYSQGAPASACQTMTPFHGGPAQTGSAPYTVSVSSVEVQPSGTVTVTVSGDLFRGFMLTAYSSDFPVGTMVSTSDLSKVVCNGLSITHTSQINKTEVSFNWTAPSDLLDQTVIDIVATIVQERLVFWVDVLQAEPLVVVEPPPDLPQGPIGPINDSTTISGGGGVLPPPGGEFLTPTTIPINTGTHGTPGGGHAGGAGGGKSSSADKNQFPGHLTADAECGQTKACFHDCTGGTCTFIISWQKADEEDLLLSMTYRVPDSNEHWIAVGFSKDQEMGDDSVTECIMHDGEIKIQQSYNQGLDNRYLDNKKAALSEETGALENGLLRCTFRRKKKYPRDPLIFDLNDDYFLLVAMGEGINGNKIPHTFDVLPPVSDHKIDLQAMENVVGEEPPVSVLVQVHGALMIISWVMLTSIGVMTAKYGKQMFPKINPCGSNIWFQIHRGCMASVAVFTVTGIVVMAVQCEGYCQIPQLPGKSHWPLHPPLGILVLLLTIINPIMAFFRPAPKAPNRFVFTWSHWGVGVLAWILASLAIFIGLDLERAHAPPEATHVMLGWGIYHIVILVAMETLPRPLCKLYSAVAEKTLQRGRIYNLERAQQDNLGYVGEDGNPAGSMQMRPTELPEAQQKTEKVDKQELTHEELKVQRMLLLIHYGVMIVFTFTLLLVVFLYTPPLPGHGHQ